MHQKIWKQKLLASSVHLGLSLLVAAVAASLVFFLWYPYPYREISGGRELFLIVIAVDVIMGPLLTLVVFNRGKPWKELRRDLAIIGLLQLSALGYGLWTVSVARPVHLVFEFDRFRVVHAADIAPELLEKAAPEWRQLPWLGPTLLGLRDFKDASEKTDATMMALRGLSLAAQPGLWQSYEKTKLEVLQKARPLAELKQRFPNRTAEIDAALAKVADSAAHAWGYIPLAGRQNFWTVLLDTHSAEVLAFVPIDSF